MSLLRNTISPRLSRYETNVRPEPESAASSPPPSYGTPSHEPERRRRPHCMVNTAGASNFAGSPPGAPSVRHFRFYSHTAATMVPLSFLPPVDKARLSPGIDDVFLIFSCCRLLPLQRPKAEAQAAAAGTSSSPPPPAPPGSRPSPQADEQAEELTGGQSTVSGSLMPDRKGRVHESMRPAHTEGWGCEGNRGPGTTGVTLEAADRRGTLRNTCGSFHRHGDMSRDWKGLHKLGKVKGIV